MRDTLILSSNRTLRLLLVLLGIATCLWGIRATAAFGLSRLFAKYALVTSDQQAAQLAIQFMPLDARAHHTAGTVSNLAGSPAAALRSIENATALRPSDYSLWLALGLIRDRIGDTAGALAAFDEAVRRAPFYAQPRWQRGNVLLRSGQYESAFQDLTQAAQSDPALVSKVIDLAWSISQGDVNLTDQLARIRTAPMRFAFAKLLARAGNSEEAVRRYQGAGINDDDVRQQLIQVLLARGYYREANDLWKRDPVGSGSGEFYDGGFEGRLVVNESGFGWRVLGELKGVTISRDDTERDTGKTSLLIRFQGESNPSSALVSQLVLVEPSQRYKVNLAARAKDIVSGGPPIAVVRQAPDRTILAQSKPLTKTNGAWTLMSFEFTAPAAASAVLVSIERDCATSPCPIFGSLYLDSFSLERK